MFCYVEVDNSPSLMRQYDEHKKHFEGHRWHDKEVDSSDIFRMLIEKCPLVRKNRIPFPVKTQQ